MLKKFRFQLERPSAFLGLHESEGLLEDYVNDISSHLNIDREEFYERLRRIIPNSISVECEGECNYFCVEGNTFEEADKIMRSFAERFKDLVREYTKSLHEIEKYGILNYC